MKNRIIFILGLFLLLVGQTRNMEAMTSENKIAPQTLTPQNIEAFITNFMAAEMEARHVPGAAVVVVQQDAVLYAGGFGRADLATEQPVDVEKTLFRAGSVSKLFTATAVMQLVEQGKVDLHGNVNDYLTSLELPELYGRPVTVADLLLHTAGFDDVFLGMHVRDAAELEPLADFLQRHLPARYLPLGEIISYNDHGYTLAGLLVEDVSGLPFADYVAVNILEPLQMSHSTFAQPIPAEWLPHMATGYGYDGSYQPYPLDFVQVSPAAGLIGPAAEMSHFMMMHLSEGAFAGTQVLEPETVAVMHQRQVAHHPALRGRGIGFSEWMENGRRAIFHDGGNPGFLSRLFLLPEEGVGFYLVFNGDQYGEAAHFHWLFTEQFLDTFFPGEDTAVALPAAAASRPLADYSGYYRDVSGYSHDTFQKLASLPDQFAVKVDGETLAAFGRRYAPVGDDLFHTTDGQSIIYFGRDDADETTYLFIGTGAYVKVPWYEAQPVQMGLVIWFVLTFLAAVVGAIVWQSAPGLLRGTVLAAGLLNLLFLSGMAIALLQVDPWQFVYGPPKVVVALLVVPLITVVLALLASGITLYGWRSGDWHTGQKLFMGLISLTALLFPVFLNLWNLFGFRY